MEKKEKGISALCTAYLVSDEELETAILRMRDALLRFPKKKGICEEEEEIVKIYWKKTLMMVPALLWRNGYRILDQLFRHPGDPARMILATARRRSTGTGDRRAGTERSISGTARMGT